MIATRSIFTFDLMCHINSSKLVKVSLRFTCALLSSYRPHKQGWMNVLNHSIKLMEEFKMLQAPETRGLLLCFLTHNKTFKARSPHLSNKGKAVCGWACAGHTYAHMRVLRSLNKSRLWVLSKVEKIFKWQIFSF